MVNDSIDFGQMQFGDINSTADDSPYPFILRNDGNTELNITINSTDLWESQPLDIGYFQMRVNYSDETNSFNWSASMTSWTNIVNDTLMIAYLNHSDANDSARMDVKIEVPVDEPKGAKSATITVIASES